MRSRGINHESVICINSYNHLDSGIPFIAAQFLGAKTCSLDPSLSEQLTLHLVKQMNPDIFFVVSECVETLEKVLKELGWNRTIVVYGPSEKRNPFEEFLQPKEDEDSFVPYQTENLRETAVVMFSSGTTGLPKGICLSHLTLLKKCVL